MSTKIDNIDRISADIRRLAAESKRIVFVSGNFNVIHPGHLRFLKFAADSGDFLIVGVLRDNSKGAFLPEQLRLEGVNNLSLVDYCFLIPGEVQDCIKKIRPHVVVKGKEFENLYNIEKDILNSYGGKLCFSSGEIRFSSMDLLQREINEINHATIMKPLDFLSRHQSSTDSLIRITESFNALNVVVIGDLIIDEYIACDALGMSQEDATIVVSPIRKDHFIGGAGIVAAHAAGLGANVKFFSIVGNDQIGSDAELAILAHGVDAILFKDESRVTTLKQRFRCEGKTLLRVSHLDQHEISKELSDRIIEAIEQDIKQSNLLVFSDFNYGCLPVELVNSIMELCAKHKVLMAADSQSSSQVGDIGRYNGVMLITPTEHEARIAIRDKDLGLAALAQALRKKSNVKNIFITLGSEGVLIDCESLLGEGFIADQLPAFNLSPKDVAGAGDSLLITASMSLAAGATGWEAAYLGSLAAACQVSRVGNCPLTLEEIMQELVK